MKKKHFPGRHSDIEHLILYERLYLELKSYASCVFLPEDWTNCVQMVSAALRWNAKHWEHLTVVNAILGIKPDLIHVS